MVLQVLSAFIVALVIFVVNDLTSSGKQLQSGKRGGGGGDKSRGGGGIKMDAMGFIDTSVGLDKSVVWSGGASGFTKFHNQTTKNFKTEAICPHTGPWLGFSVVRVGYYLERNEYLSAELRCAVDTCEGSARFNMTRLDRHPAYPKINTNLSHHHLLGDGAMPSIPVTITGPESVTFRFKPVFWAAEGFPCTAGTPITHPTEDYKPTLLKRPILLSAEGPIDGLLSSTKTSTNSVE